MEPKLRGPASSSEALNLSLGDFEAMPLCVANRREFNAKSEKRIEQMAGDFDCDRFVQYQPGMSPKEHIIMDIVDRFEKRQSAATMRTGLMLVAVAGVFTLIGAYISRGSGQPQPIIIQQKEDEPRRREVLPDSRQPAIKSLREIDP